MPPMDPIVKRTREQHPEAEGQIEEYGQRLAELAEAFDQPASLVEGLCNVISRVQPDGAGGMETTLTPAILVLSTLSPDDEAEVKALLQEVQGESEEFSITKVQRILPFGMQDSRVHLISGNYAGGEPNCWVVQIPSPGQSPEYTVQTIFPAFLGIRGARHYSVVRNYGSDGLHYQVHGDNTIVSLAHFASLPESPRGDRVAALLTRVEEHLEYVRECTSKEPTP